MPDAPTDPSATDELSLVAKQLWALGDKTRLQLLALLPDEANCEQGNNVSQLAEQLGLSQPTVSHHLRILRQGGFIEFRKMCRDVFYWKKPEAIQLLTALIPRVTSGSQRP